jgi:hypothetical protein
MCQGLSHLGFQVSDLFRVSGFVLRISCRKERSMSTEIDDKKKSKAAAPRFHKRPQVPPPDSSVWPKEYRGQRWKGVYAFFFAGKCQLCAYSFAGPVWRQWRTLNRNETRMVFCTNHPSFPGELVSMLPTSTCRNFKKKAWWLTRARQVAELPAPPDDQSDPTVRRIPLGNGYFATVDAADYDMLSKYKWHARRNGRLMYAFCRKGGKQISMHRMIMRPRRGYVVDHLDHNGLNNRRCNLHVCTQGENVANARSHGGASGFVGVGRARGNKWKAGITVRGKYYSAGQFSDPVEAAKARDRLAYDLLGPHAYLNFPEDFPPPEGTSNHEGHEDHEG